MTRIGRSALLSAALVALAVSGPLAASEFSSYSVSVLVDGDPVPEYAARNRIYVEAIKGKEFVIRLSNPTSRRVAVALSVDGRNVIDAKRTSAGEAAKWVLSPGETLDVPGWQVSGASARRFFFTETSKSYAKWLGDTANIGTIEAVFYRERERVREKPIVRWKASPESQHEEGASDEEARSYEGVPGGTLGNGMSQPVPSAQAPESAPKESRARKDADYAATGIGDATSNPVEWVAFESESSPAARIGLRYEFRTELVRLGVLPRPYAPDGLYARDRAHGFDREYAPDPYRR